MRTPTIKACAPCYCDIADHVPVEFAVADLSDISWNESLFHQLAISSKPKKLIEALTTFQSSRKAKYAFDDFVEGKGRGLIVLLKYVHRNNDRHVQG